jgi:hypothetical protein
METLNVDASTVVCLTEPGIVDASFERAGALPIPEHDEGPPRSRARIVMKERI